MGNAFVLLAGSFRLIARVDRRRQAAEDRHPAFESEELERDLALVVIHAEHGVIVAASRLDPDSVGREGPIDRMAPAPAFLDGRADDVDLLATEHAAFARMRI